MTKIAGSLREIFWPGDRSDKPVYLQETGELLGYISDIETDEDGRVKIYTVDCDGVDLSFSSENIIEGDDGYIYQPIWLTEGEKIVEKLETQQRVNPEIASHTSENISKGRLKQIFSRSNPELEETVEKARDIAELLIEKKNSLEDKKESLQREIEEKTEKRMSGEGSRRDFAEAVVDLKRKAKIAEENLNKVEQLYTRLKKNPLIDMEGLKRRVEEDMSPKKENLAKDRPKTRSDSEVKNNPEGGGRREKESERIKKIRIPKLEQQFEQKEDQIQQAYLADLQERIKSINQDIKDLKELSEEHEGDEKIKDFIDKKLDNLKEEKKDLREKIEEVKKNENSVEKTPSEEEKSEANIEGLVEEKTTEKASSEEQKLGNSKGINGEKIARLGFLALIIGIIVLLILSLLRVF
ncbi:MAG: hypothetical protein KGY76_05565 [Candidatus Thermoplasmatota archaeon]|nr:hypothetical protein [Candidatus Thermoplasmatota archaeon]